MSALQQRKVEIPISINNFFDMPFGDSRIVCRDSEIQDIKRFVYGRPGDLRKQHSCCIYGYGGIGKTALVLEVLKQIVCDLQDGLSINGYQPEFVLFFSAKKRKISLASETGRFIEQPIKSHFETAEELMDLILSNLKVISLRDCRVEGLIVIDNLETLSIEERQKVKTFVETQTPSGMQFILTSRNSEEYDLNYKLAGFNSEIGRRFICDYSKDNSLDLELSDSEQQELLSLAKGNTLVLVLCIRRLSKRLSTINSLKSEFSSGNAWSTVKKTLSKTPSNAYEVIAEFMYKDTFEHIEASFSINAELFYKVLKVFAILQNESTDLSTLCLLTDESYPDMEEVVDILCSYLILEKKDTQYSLNEFAEKYIVSRFLPDSETYERLSADILARQRNVHSSLERLKEDIIRRPSLAKIISDWHIFTDVDKIMAAQMYDMYGDVKHNCDNAGKYKVETVLEDFTKKCEDAEKLTAHPFIKFEKARILQLVDQSNIFSEKHIESIKKSFGDAIYSIKTIDQYSGIQQTKSYASLLWLYGRYLSDVNDIQAAIRFLEEGRTCFEEQNNKDQEYFLCLALLGHKYLEYYLQDRPNRLTYLRRARAVSRLLETNWEQLGSARTPAGQLKSLLRSYGS